MKNLQLWSAVIARLTRGATPIDGFMIPAGNDTHEKQVENRVQPPHEPLTCEAEFEVAMFPKLGNFR